MHLAPLASEQTGNACFPPFSAPNIFIFLSVRGQGLDNKKPGRDRDRVFYITCFIQVMYEYIPVADLYLYTHYL